MSGLERSWREEGGGEEMGTINNEKRMCERCEKADSNVGYRLL